MRRRGAKGRFFDYNLNLQIASLAPHIRSFLQESCSVVDAVVGWSMRIGPGVLCKVPLQLCSALCLQKNTRVYPCMWCKTLCKNFDMLPNVDRSGKMGLFCSICCTTSHKVKQSGLVGKDPHTVILSPLYSTPFFVLVIACG